MRKSFYIVAIFLLLTGPPVSGFAQLFTDGTLTHDRINRAYYLYIPESYTGDEPAPLIFVLHGSPQSLNNCLLYTNFPPIADIGGFIVVYPSGTTDGMGNPFWDCDENRRVDDLGFIEALLDSISAGYNIDQTRVYAAGFSNGGFMSYSLACERSDRFAAIASVTGSMYPFMLTTCKAQHPTPILEIHGTHDHSVSYNGVPRSESIDNVMAYWANFNNCDPTASITDLPDIYPNDGSTVEHIVYGGCDNSVTVEHFKIDGGGHTWPGTGVSNPGTNNDMNATIEIWKFFSKYNINGLISAPPVSDDYKLVMNWAEENIPEVFNPQGKMIMDIPPLRIRYYPVTDVYLAYNTSDDRFYAASEPLLGDETLALGLLSEYLQYLPLSKKRKP
ncbi:MAG: prolyl oligopeptidase family serine peptidase [Planctomycetes bacterium]|nr:prolyl oligopeptidase family serine peptidase [Planctomycetota bacterium]